MRALVATALLAGLLVFLGACRFLSSDERDSFYFDIIYEDVETEGTGTASIEDDTLVIRGEYMQPDSSMRYVELTVADFDGERTYDLGRTDGIYGATDGEESVKYGYSSGLPDDDVRIDAYDADGELLTGAFFFYATAYQDFDDVGAFLPFRVAGSFRTRVD